MGKALAKLFGKKDMRILMLGLDAAGKTSIPLKITENILRIYWAFYTILMWIGCSLLPPASNLRGEEHLVTNEAFIGFKTGNVFVQ